jgi:hypothetical protein
MAAFLATSVSSVAQLVSVSIVSVSSVSFRLFILTRSLLELIKRAHMGPLLLYPLELREFPPVDLKEEKSNRLSFIQCLFVWSGEIEK